MKRIWVLLAGLLLCMGSFAQDNDNGSEYGELKGGFRQENIFIGGSLNLGFGSGQLTLGGSPEVGYTIAPWLDAGIGLNLIYTSIAANTIWNPSSTKFRQLNYGGGPFVRLYPVNFLFIQGQYEHNWTKIKVVEGMSSYKQTVNASSFIAGIGYSQRVIGQGGYYFLVGLDLLKNQYSPYVTENSLGQMVARPIIRGGFNFYLKPAKGARQPRYGDSRTL